jgi:hypothetical protein
LASVTDTKIRVLLDCARTAGKDETMSAAATNARQHALDER